jgi:hemolysin activation/secretion protein
MRKPYLRIILFFLTYWSFVNPSFAEISNVSRQDQIIRNQQQTHEEEKRRREFEKIRKEREQLEKQQKESDKKLEKSQKSSHCFPIKKIKLTGSESLTKRQKKKITSPFLGKCFDGSVLGNLVQRTNAMYSSMGFATTQVTVPKQNLTRGNLKLEIVEGKIEDIILNDNKFTDKMQEFTAFGFKKDKALDMDDINQGMYQINRLSSNNAKMRIEPGNKAGTSKVVINNKKTFPVSVKLGYDNLGNEFTGIRRTNFSSTIDNLFFLNDQINLSYNTNLDDPSNEKDLRSFSGGISVPFTYNTLSYNYSRTKFGGQNSGINGPLKLTGYSNSNNIAIDRTLLNNTEYRISTNLSLTAKETASYLNDSKIETSERKLTIGSLSFAISKYFKNGATLYLKPQYNRGLKLLNANQDEQGLTADIPRAQFQLYKLYASLSKRFQIPKTTIPVTLTTEMDSQLSKDTLFGSEQFAVGGYYSVRGFRENFITGDHGYYFRNKVSFNLGQILAPILAKKEGDKKDDSFISKNSHHLYKITMEPFYDYGYVKTKYNGQGEINSGRLSGAGLKTIFSSKYFDASLTYSWALQKSNLITSTDKENKMLYFELSAKY